MLIASLVSIIRSPYLRFGREVSSQDLWKFFAMLTMIIDHVGVYFFSQDITWRIIGRLSMPVWLFFVGYNFHLVKIKFDIILFLGLLMQIIGSIYKNEITLQFNILITVFLTKVVLFYYKKHVVSSFNLFQWFFINISCLLCSTLANCFFEYGSLAFLIAIWGYNYRYNIGNHFVQTISTYITITLVTAELFHFDFTNIFLLSFIMGILIYYLHSYKHNIIYPKITGVAQYIINIFSRYSLYIYVTHLFIFSLLKL
jgi:hypothetical protein